MVAAACALTVLVGCSGGSGGSEVTVELVLNAERCVDAPLQPEPVVDLIDDAMATVDQHYGREVDLFEVSADVQRVSVVAAIDGVAEQAFYCGALGFAAPEPLGEADGPTFRSGDVELEPDRIFDQLQLELGSPAIRDLAVRVDPELGLIRDATVVSTAGGILLVLLGSDGTILGVQGE
jgi:hypothetical protein